MSNREQEDLLTNRNKNQLIQNGGHNAEKLPFLNEPVRLTPAWEANNLPNDELNFKGMTMERAEMEMSPPYDKYRLVFYTFLIHGLGTLMPWNMFITAKLYFVKFKLDAHYTERDDLLYATYFMSYIGFASQIPNLLFNWLNVFVKFGGSLTSRIFWSLLIEICIFIVTVILAMVDSSSWPDVFFWITMVSVVILNMASGIYQNTIYGMAASMPIKYTGAVVLGSNICGLFTSVLALISNLIFPTKRTAAIYYFITAIFVLLVCFDTYFALPLNKYYRYHEMLKEKEAEKIKKSQESRTPYWEIFKQSSPQLFNVFFIFFVTLSIFPAIYSDVKYVDNGVWFPVTNSDRFTDITCYITFNLFAMLGSLTTSWVQWPKAQYLVIPVVLRIVFTPLFIFCNYVPENLTRTMPVFITSNWVYWFMGMLMAYSSGYLSSLAMMYAPQTVSPKHATTAGMFAAAMLITGIFTGIMTTYAYPDLVSKLSW